MCKCVCELHTFHRATEPQSHGAYPAILLSYYSVFSIQLFSYPTIQLPATPLFSYPLFSYSASHQHRHQHRHHHQHHHQQGPGTRGTCSPPPLHHRPKTHRPKTHYTLHTIYYSSTTLAPPRQPPGPSALRYIHTPIQTANRVQKSGKKNMFRSVELKRLSAPTNER